MAPQPVCVVKHFEGIHTMLLAVKRTHATSVLYIAIFMISNSDCISQRRNDLTSSARAFETHNKIGISLCKRRCVDRPGCQAVQYRVKQMSCELMSVNSSQLHRVLTKGLVFTNKKSWNSVYGCSAVVCGNSSRCVMTHGGLTRHATYKCVEQGMRKKKKKSAPKGYLIYEPGKNRLFHAKRPDKSLERIHIFNSNNEYVSVTYDAGKVYFLCRDGKRLAWAQYYSHSIKLNDDCMILNGSGYGHYKWIGVDSGPGYIFASTNKRKYQLQIFKTHGDNLFPIGHINPVVDDIHMFQLYKKNREIYWVDTNLKSIHYNGSGLKNFKTIEMHNFFMDFTEHGIFGVFLNGIFFFIQSLNTDYGKLPFLIRNTKI